jgi:RNA polymerase sigma factor for flagellar operon FliA
MNSLQGVSSALIARHESWVRKQAQSLVRQLPANVERADLIQVGLIAVAQAALTFEYEGERETEEANDAFVRYARQRVKGAMLDELRQMDHLGRSQRRKLKIVQIARERWRSANATEPGLAKLSELTGLPVDEIATLEQADEIGRTRSSTEESDDDSPERFHPSTDKEEVEARVDTAIVLRRLERFFARLPERDRMVIDSYLGVGLQRSELAESLAVSPSRISQIYQAVVHRIATHFGHADRRSIDRVAVAARFEQLVNSREQELQRAPGEGPWGELIEEILNMPREQFGALPPDDEPIRVSSSTRWG